MCTRYSGPPVVLGKLHTWVSPYVSSETTRPSAPLRLSHGPDGEAPAAITLSHTGNLTVRQLLGNITSQAADASSRTGTYQSHFNNVILCVCVCVCVCVWRSSGSTAWVMCSYPVGAKHPKNVREKSDHQSTCSQISRVQGWLYRTGLLKQEYVTSCSKIVGCGVSSQAAKPKRQYLTI